MNAPRPVPSFDSILRVAQQERKDVACEDDLLTDGGCIFDTLVGDDDRVKGRDYDEELTAPAHAVSDGDAVNLRVVITECVGGAVESPVGVIKFIGIEDLRFLRFL